MPKVRFEAMTDEELDELGGVHKITKQSRVRRCDLPEELAEMAADARSDEEERPAKPSFSFKFSEVAVPEFAICHVGQIAFRAASLGIVTKLVSLADPWCVDPKEEPFEWPEDLGEWHDMLDARALQYFF